MRVKKVLMTLTTLMVFLIPVNAFASEIQPLNTFTNEIQPLAAGWQMVGYDKITMTANKNSRTKPYTSIDGGNFKIEFYGNKSGTVSGSMYVNGFYRFDTTATSISGGRGALEFSGLKAGDTVQFDIMPTFNDTFELKFYD